MIIARDLAVAVGSRRLLSEASFSLQAGDKVGLVGPNGAGKTTLLRTLAGERSADSGVVARSGVVGYLSQEAALGTIADRAMTALERILMARDIGMVERRMEQTRVEMEATSGPTRDRLIRRFARLDDELLVSAELTWLKGARQGFRQEMTRREDGELIASAELSAVMLNADTLKPARMPAWIREHLEDLNNAE